MILWVAYSKNLGLKDFVIVILFVLCKQFIHDFDILTILFLIKLAYGSQDALRLLLLSIDHD